MVAVHLALTYLKGTLRKISNLLGVNEFATVGSSDQSCNKYFDDSAVFPVWMNEGKR